MAAIQSGAAGLAAAAAAPPGGTSRQRKRTSRAGSEVNASDAGGQSTVRGAKKVQDSASPATSLNVSKGDKQEAATSTGAATSQGIAVGTVAGTSKQSWSSWLLHRAEKGLGEKHIRNGQQVTKAVRTFVRSPLFSTLIIISLAGLITSFLVDLTPRRRAPALSEATSDDLAAIQNRLLSLDEHVHKMLPKLVVQVEVANSRVDKLQREHSELSGEVKLGIERLGGDVKVLKARFGMFDPFVQRLLANGGEEMKKELEQLVNSAVHKRAAEGAGHALSLEDIRVAARSVVEEELARHAADDIAMPDYALASGGGRVLEHSEAVHGKVWGLSKLGMLVGKGRLHPMAQKVLEPLAGVPGHCLPLKGTNGSVDIALRTNILPSEITLEHISESVSYEIQSAPRNIRVFGWQRVTGDPKASEPILPKVLGEYTYDIKKRTVQTFKLRPEVRANPINAVRLQILSNHGNPSHTCLYRLRVHGSPVMQKKPAQKVEPNNIGGTHTP